MGDRKYPSILEIALKAGKWSVLAGSSAAIIGGSYGCVETEESGDTGDRPADVLQADQNQPDYPGVVVDVVLDHGFQDVQDANEGPDEGWPELAGVAPYDANIDNDQGGTDVITPDTVESDPGLMGDFMPDAVFPPSDVVDANQAVDASEPDASPDAEWDGFLSGGAPMEDA